MQITDEILISLGANPLIYGAPEKEKIGEYAARMESGDEISYMYPSTEILDSERAELKNAYKKRKEELKKMLTDLDLKANELYNICEGRSDIFGEPKTEAALDELMLLSSWRIQEADEIINDALDKVDIIYAIFLRLSDILNEYRLLFLESNLVYLAEQITDRSSNVYAEITAKINEAMEACHALAFETYEYAHAQEIGIERNLQLQMNALGDALKFNEDGKGIKVHAVLEEIRKLRQITQKSINLE